MSGRYFTTAHTLNSEENQAHNLNHNQLAGGISQSVNRKFSKINSYIKISYKLLGVEESTSLIFCLFTFYSTIMTNEPTHTARMTPGMPLK